MKYTERQREAERRGGMMIDQLHNEKWVSPIGFPGMTTQELISELERRGFVVTRKERADV